MVQSATTAPFFVYDNSLRRLQNTSRKQLPLTQICTEGSCPTLKCLFAQNTAFSINHIFLPENLLRDPVNGLQRHHDEKCVEEIIETDSG